MVVNDLDLVAVEAAKQNIINNNVPTQLCIVSALCFSAMSGMYILTLIL